MNNRLQFLDSLRGIAILMVLGYHAFARWPEIVPYADRYAEIEVFRQGLLGVQLFFLISGFVILMSLGACKGPVVFLFKRWARLFPVMLVATVIVYLSSGVFHERPWGQPQLVDILPGLTFVEPGWWSAVLGHEVRAIEGAFWSLYVEFKFYVIAAILFFTIGRERLVYALCLMFAISMTLSQLASSFSHPVISILLKISNNLSFEYFGWFASGAAFYLHYKSRQRFWVYFAIGLAIVSSLDSKFATGALIVSLLFIIAMVNETVQKLLVSRILLFFGYISYPLYLIHENAMISLIVKLGVFIPWMPGYLLPVIPLVAVAALAYLIAKYLDSQIKGWILIQGFRLGHVVGARHNRLGVNITGLTGEQKNTHAGA